MKNCTKCNQIKPLSDFCKNKNTKDGLQYYCTSCFKATNKQRYAKNSQIAKARSRAQYASNRDWHLNYVKNWNKNNSRRVKNNALLRDYGITINHYEELLVKQENKCAICNIHQKDLKIMLAVDHNHSTGKVRGLLCDPCNRGMGFFKENKDTFANVIKYLEVNDVC